MSIILVAGSTGLLGSEICRQLRAAGKSVRGLVRESSDRTKVDGLQSFGVETIVGDLRHRASLDRACEGVTHVITTASAMPFSYEPGVNDLQTTDLEGNMNLIEAAKAQGIVQFTFISGRIDVAPDSPLTRTFGEVERRLKESGLTYTILRASFMMEVWLSPAVGFDPVNGKATIYGQGQHPISWIAVQDVAQFAVASVDHPAAKNTTLVLGGPEAISPLDIVKIFEEVGGRSLELQCVPVEVLEAQQAAATDPMQESFSAAMRYYAAGDRIEMSDTFRTFAIQPMTVKDYARRILLPA